jgi:hypothetical protein
MFLNVSEEDYGNYTCVALNTMGITNASIILYGKTALLLLLKYYIGLILYMFLCYCVHWGCNYSN